MIKIYKYGEVSAEEIFARENLSANVEDIVAGILAEVKAAGDKALLDYTEKFDKVRLSALEVSEAEIDEAFLLNRFLPHRFLPRRLLHGFTSSNVE